jgi:hypothetical protein
MQLVKQFTVHTLIVLRFGRGHARTITTSQRVRGLVFRDVDRLQVVGIVFALVAVVGTIAFDWEFGGDTGPVPFALAAVAVVLAVASHFRDA